MKVLVTGGAGFVGRRFVKRFLNANHNVTVVDDFSTGLEPRKWAGPVELSPREIDNIDWDAIDCRLFFRSRMPADYDLIVHCAAVVGGRRKIERDPIAVATDLSIDAEFFNWVSNPGATAHPKVIYFSSSAVYPIELQREHMHCALHESHVNFDAYRISMPDATYGWAKLTGELLARYAAKTYGLDVVIYRPFSGYGEDQDLTYPFPALLQKISRGDAPVEVWGTGMQQRDFIHIDDVVDCVLATYDKLAPGTPLNIGSGQGVTFNDLIVQMGQEIGRRGIQVESNLDEPQGVFNRVADATEMLRRYTPKIPLRDGINRVYQHLKAHGLLDKEPVEV